LVKWSRTVLDQILAKNMLVIRFFRTGKKNQPSFKIVVTDKRRPTRAGRFVEEVGFWNPVTKEKVLRQERIKYWLSVGAKPSNRVYNLLVSEKIVEGKKIDVHKKPKEKKGKPAEGPAVAPTTEAKAAAAPTETAPAETAAVKKEAKPEEKPSEPPAEEKPAEVPPGKPTIGENKEEPKA